MLRVSRWLWLTAMTCLAVACATGPGPRWPVSRSTAAPVTLIQLDGLSHAALSDYLQNLSPAERQTSTLGQLVNLQVSDIGGVVFRNALAIESGTEPYPYRPTASHLLLSGPSRKEQMVALAVPGVLRRAGVTTASIGYDVATGANFVGSGADDHARTDALIGWARQKNVGFAAVRFDALLKSAHVHGEAALRPTLKRIDTELARLAAQTSLLDTKRRFVVLSASFGLRRATRPAQLLDATALCRASECSAAVPMGGTVLLHGVKRDLLQRIYDTPGVDKVLFHDGPVLYVRDRELETLRPVADRDFPAVLRDELLDLTNPGDALVVLARTGCDTEKTDNDCYTAEPIPDARTYLIRGGFSDDEMRLPLMLAGPHIANGTLPPVSPQHLREFLLGLMGKLGAGTSKDVNQLLERVWDAQYTTRYPATPKCDGMNAKAAGSCARLLVATRDSSVAASVINRIAATRSFSEAGTSSLARASAWLLYPQSRESLPDAFLDLWPVTKPKCERRGDVLDLGGHAPECIIALSADLPADIRDSVASALATSAGAHLAVLDTSVPRQRRAVVPTPTLDRWLGPAYLAFSGLVTTQRERAFSSLAAGLRAYEEGVFLDAERDLENARELPGDERQWRDLFLHWSRSELKHTSLKPDLPEHSWIAKVAQIHDAAVGGAADLAAASEAASSEAESHPHRALLAAARTAHDLQLGNLEPCSSATLERTATQEQLVGIREAAERFVELGQPGLAADAYTRLAYYDQNSATKSEALMLALAQLKQPAAAWLRWRVLPRVIDIAGNRYDAQIAREYATKLLLSEAQHRSGAPNADEAVLVFMPLLAVGIHPTRIQRVFSARPWRPPPFVEIVDQLLRAYTDPTALALLVMQPNLLRDAIDHAITIIDTLYPDYDFNAVSDQREYEASLLYLLMKGLRDWRTDEKASARSLLGQAGHLALQSRSLVLPNAADFQALAIPSYAVVAAAISAVGTKEAGQHSSDMLAFLVDAAVALLGHSVAERELVRRHFMALAPTLEAAMAALVGSDESDEKASKRALQHLEDVLAKSRLESTLRNVNTEYAFWLRLADIAVRDAVLALHKTPASPKQRQLLSRAGAGAEYLMANWHPESNAGRFALRGLYALQEILPELHRLTALEDVARYAPNLIHVAEELASDLEQQYPSTQLRQALDGDPSLFQLAAGLYTAVVRSASKTRIRTWPDLQSVIVHEVSELVASDAASTRPSVSKAMFALYAAFMKKDPPPELLTVGKRASGKTNIPGSVWDIASLRGPSEHIGTADLIENLQRISNECPVMSADMQLDIAHAAADERQFGAAAAAVEHYLHESRYQGGAGLTMKAGLKSQAGTEVMTTEVEVGLSTLPFRDLRKSFSVGYGFSRGSCCENGACKPCELVEDTHSTLSLSWKDSAAVASVRGGELLGLYLMANGEDERADRWLANLNDVFYGMDPVNLPLDGGKPPRAQYSGESTFTGDPLLPLWLGTLAELRGHIAVARYMFTRAEAEAKNAKLEDLSMVEKKCEVDESADRIVELARCYEPSLIPSWLATTQMRELVHLRTRLALGAQIGAAYVEQVRKVQQEIIPPWAADFARALVNHDPSLMSPQVPSDVALRYRVRLGAVSAEDSEALQHWPCESTDSLYERAKDNQTPANLLLQLAHRCDASQLAYNVATLIAKEAANLDTNDRFEMWFTAANHLRYVPQLADAVEVWTNLYDEFWHAPGVEHASRILQLATKAGFPQPIVDMKAYLYAMQDAGGVPVRLDEQAVALATRGFGTEFAREYILSVADSQRRAHDPNAVRRYLVNMKYQFTKVSLRD